MIVIGIDPGTRESGYVVWDGNKILDKENTGNEDLLNGIRNCRIAYPGNIIAVEGMQYFGKAVGKDVFETCYFIGRVMEAASCSVKLVYRKDVKLFLTGTVKSKDKDIRATLISRLGKEVTNGISSHLWSALAIAIFYYETQVEKIYLEKRKIQ